MTNGGMTNGGMTKEGMTKEGMTNGGMTKEGIANGTAAAGRLGGTASMSGGFVAETFIGGGSPARVSVMGI